MAGVFKIGVVSQKTGLSAATLRLWEDQYGLLTPMRSRGGTRLYSESDVERALYVRQLVRERGYALGAIAAIIDQVASSLPYSLDRVAIENIYLRDATNHTEIEEGRRLARVQAMLRSLIRAESGHEAAMTLVAGVRALTGAQTVGLGLYRRKTDTLTPMVTASRDRLGTTSLPPLPVSALPRAWQEAIEAREPYAVPDLDRLDLPVEVNSQVLQSRTRSFHAQPLAIADEMVGILALASPRPGGIGSEAIRVCEELSVAAGPAMHYFAQHLESPAPEPRL
jgi:DNA-binding transcriptional MerR regulator